MKTKKRLAGLMCVALGFTLSSCGGGGGSTSPTTSVQVTPTPTPVTYDGTITLEGTVAKGLFFGAPVAVFSSNDVLEENDNILASTTTNQDDGSYTLTLTTDDVRDYGEYLIVGTALNEAEMMCDSPIGCSDRAEFGERFSILPSSAQTPELFIFSIIPTPDINSTNRVNLNIFTTMQFNLMDNQLSARPVLEFDQTIIDSAAERVSTIFEFSDASFESYEFVDLTHDVNSSNTDHIRASLISGGLQATMSKFRDTLATPDEIGFEWGFFNFLDYFVRNDGELLANADYSYFLISLLNIYEDAKGFETLDINGNNAYGVALQSIEDSYEAVLASDRYADTLNGELTPPGPNEPPEFFNAERSLIQFNEGNTGSVDQYPYDLNLTAFDPDGDTLVFSINSGPDSGAFEIMEDMFLSPLQPFDCARPDDVDGNHRYEVTVNYSDGEFSGTQDLDIRVYADDGNFCPGFSSKLGNADGSTAVASTSPAEVRSKHGILTRTLADVFANQQQRDAQAPMR